MQDTMIEIIIQHFPRVQAIYLFGSHGTEDEWPQSDIDIALLLPPQEARQAGCLAISPCAIALSDAMPKMVDLVNLRQVSTVFQHEIIHHGHLIYCADRSAVDAFEMVTMSMYQKLNEERAGILEAFRKSGRAWPV